MSESVERSTERHHASITTCDVKRDAAERFLRDDYQRALRLLLVCQNEAVSTPAWMSPAVPIVDCVIEDFVSDSDRKLVAELLAIVYACSISGDGSREMAEALITRLEDEHVQTHLDAAAEE